MKEWESKWNPFNSDKLMAHVYRWKEIQKGNEIPPPVLVTVDPTNVCNLDCTWCNSQYLRNKNKVVKERLSSSFLSILKLGKSKGYTYFGMLSGNSFWIRNDLAEKLGDLLMSEEEVNKQMEKFK